MDREWVAGRFRLGAQIGAGGMGQVRKAEDTESPADGDTHVAVKLILQTRTGAPLDPSATATRRFLREVEVMQRLRHPRIPRLVDGGVDTSEGGYLPYLAMELLDGVSLWSLTTEEPQLPLSWAAAIGAQAADALHAAHRAGIVHRDIKPANIVLTRGGWVKVLDFGMGRIVDDPDVSRLTSTDTTVGTARYMAPEQFAGADVTAAADLYALGCVLYELLTGTLPFDGATNYELGYKHTHEYPPPIAITRKGLPAPLSRLIDRLLAKDPAERPQSADEVRRALVPMTDPGEELPGWSDYDPGYHVPHDTTPTRPTERTPGPAPATQSLSAGNVMDVFAVHDRLIADYHAFTQGGTVIRDEEIADFVAGDLESKSQWPDPWISLNPFFASGGTAAELVAQGALHEECTRIFQAGKKEGSRQSAGSPLSFYRHQREAIEAARSGESYVLTTGTGSGKSLSYIVPIVDRVLRERAQERKEGRRPAKRTRAIIVYPMNALANSQMEELTKYLTHGYGEGNEPVTFARYTGQEGEEKRKALRDDPPDILLTNYVMLELMLTRPGDRGSVIAAARGLSFLVFDELHTYRGRQGADVALLIRRVREACEAPDVQCVGTSATMASGGTAEERRATVAEVATRLFGTEVRPERVITESLVRATDTAPESVPATRLAEESPRGYNELYHDPLARWIESAFGLTTDADGLLVRQQPTTVEAAAEALAAETGTDAPQCVAAIRRTLEAGAQVRNPVTGRPLFAFRLHQFLAKGDTVHTTLEPRGERHLTRDYQVELPGSDGKILFPLAFCRECGQEYLVSWRSGDRSSPVFRARRGQEPEATGDVEGYLYVSTDNAWPADLAKVLEKEKLPDSWTERDSSGDPIVRKSYQHRLPTPVDVDAHGLPSPDGLRATFIPAPFLFCLHCGVSYEQVRGRDFAKLATLDQEGRSSATSLVSASVVRSLTEVPAEALPESARKLLTFVDNRQDASLQAGHFNDFIQVTRLRGALYRALVEAGAEGLTHEHLADRVVETMGLTRDEFLDNPEAAPGLVRRAATAVRDVVAFRLFRDLERGWRVTMPNLEQTGLLQIDYDGVAWLARGGYAAEGGTDPWADVSPLLRHTNVQQREDILRALLDEMRRALAIDVRYFTDEFDSYRSATERLSDSWQLAENDRPKVGTAYPHPSRPGLDRSGLYLSARGKFGRYLKRHLNEPDAHTEDLQETIADLLKMLNSADLVVEVAPPSRGRGPRFRREEPGTVGYRVNSACLVWRAGSGEEGVIDPLTRTYAAGQGPRVNTFFRDLYAQTAETLPALHAREHTAQISPDKREKYERAFSSAELKLLYCSPTLELGVDIADLNAVMMRNVPPTPANYAQRSGRAGRSGQPALVVTYCATGNSHDQYYFRNSERMVAGVVQPPRLDLANEDLVAAHVQAIWLAETGLKLGQGIPRSIDIAYDEDQRVPEPALELQQDTALAIADSGAQRRAVSAARSALADVFPQLQKMVWWDDSWLERKVRNAPEAFNRSFDRWRGLYRSALADRAEQHRRILDHTLSERDQSNAKKRRLEAETQINLLKNESQDSKSLLSDFGPYRYLASEGFLPGYSFPRLPLAAYIPSSGRRFGDGDYLQRPRFVAIREFGPGALIYHEGSRYQVNRIQLPPESAGEVVTGSARRCVRCGYHHEDAPGIDVCALCRTKLGAATHGQLQLHTVFTTRRERISSDEEERRRAGFRLETSFCFTDHGERQGRQDAEVADAAGPIATLQYGDSATVRISNMGRLTAKADEPDGFWLDPGTGRWLNESDAAKAVGDSGQMPLIEDGGEDRGRKVRVIPFVEDRRNIVVLQLAEALPRDQALTLMYALERGIEATFELEDSELTAELLPPDDGPRDRILFTEAAEGGAGVLRRLEAEQDALAKAARTALRICHMDDSGADLAGACARGCYDCLLTYGNQGSHRFIDRRLIRGVLVRLAASAVVPTGAGVSRTDHMDRLTFGSESSLEREFVAYLKERGHRLPDQQQVYIPEAQAKPDFIYRLPGSQVAVFVDGPVHDIPTVAERDGAAEERLDDAGWLVVRFAHDDDWSAIVARHVGCFGPGSAR